MYPHFLIRPDIGNAVAETCNDDWVLDLVPIVNGVSCSSCNSMSPVLHVVNVINIMAGDTDLAPERAIDPIPFEVVV